MLWRHDGGPRLGPEAEVRPEQGYSGRFKDDMTGQVLSDDLVKDARAKELEFLTSRGVWVKVAIRKVFERKGRQPISA